jgi:polysaccharide biosynthesis/export protein
MRLILGLFFAAASAVSAAGIAAADAYRLHAGDALEITVWQEPKLNKQVVVAPDGRISFPLVGHLQAGGKTVEAVEAALKAGLAKQYTTDIDVNVALLAIKEKPYHPPPPVKVLPPPKIEYPSIYVTGEVGKPGRYEIKDATNVLQAIAMSGGLSPFAAERRIKIRRQVSGTEELYDFDYEAFTHGDDLSGNIELVGGDVVIVLERELFE